MKPPESMSHGSLISSVLEIEPTQLLSRTMEPFPEITSRPKKVSKRALFETPASFLIFPEQEGYRLVSKLVPKSKFQNLTYVMSFDTLVIYDTENGRPPDH